MNKQKILIGGGLTLFLLGLWASWQVLQRSHSTQVRIVQDGKVLYTLDLDKTDDTLLRITYDGRENVIQIENGHIRMLSADCPDKTCVHRGWLNDSPMVLSVCRII